MVSKKPIILVAIVVLVAAAVYFGFFGGGQAAVSKTFHYETAPSPLTIDKGRTSTRTFSYKPVTVGSGETAKGTLSITVWSEAGLPTFGNVTVAINGKDIGKVEITELEPAKFSVEFDPSLLKEGTNSVEITGVEYSGGIHFELDVVVKPG